MVRCNVRKKGSISPLPEKGTKSAEGSPKPEADLEEKEEVKEVKSPQGEVIEETE